MTENKNDEQTALDFNPLILLIWRRRKILALVAAFSILASVGISFLMTPLYESHAVVFPLLSSSVDKQVEEQEIGYDVHAERLVQILESDAVKDTIISQFNLMDHYNVDPASITWWDELREKYYARIRIIKSKFKSVLIVVDDHDPKMAADIANAIAEVSNHVNARLRNRNSREILSIVEKEMDQNLKQVKMLGDSLEKSRTAEKGKIYKEITSSVENSQAKLNRLRDSIDFLRRQTNTFDPINDFRENNANYISSKSQYLSDSTRLAFLKTRYSDSDTMVIKAQAATASSLQKMKYYLSLKEKSEKVLTPYERLTQRIQSEVQLVDVGLQNAENFISAADKELLSPEIVKLETEYRWALEHMNITKERYKKAMTNFIDPAPFSFKVAEAKPSYKKIRPVLLLNVAIGLALSLFFTIVVFALADMIRRLKMVA